MVDGTGKKKFQRRSPGFDGGADGVDIEEHALRIARGRGCERNEAKLGVPSDAMGIGIGNDTTAADFVGDAEADAECVGNQGAADSSAGEAAVDSDATVVFGKANKYSLARWPAPGRTPTRQSSTK